MRKSSATKWRLFDFRAGVLLILFQTILCPSLAWAQLELGASAYLDSVKVTTPEVSESRGSLLAGLLAGYRMDPWTVSAEFASGGSPELDRDRTELAVAYSLSDSLAVTAGARHEDIAMKDVDYFWFFFVPVGVESTVAEIDLTEAFVGIQYETDPQRPRGFLGSARVYRGSADLSAYGGGNHSGDTEGYRVQLAVRMGPPQKAIIAGAAYESSSLSDARVDLSSEPVLFVQYRYRFSP